jgi:hypothetical protein
MHDDYLDPDRHLWREEEPVKDEAMINSEADLMALYETDRWDLVEKYVYKYTDCGAHVARIEGGVSVGSIVEGVDWGTEEHELMYPFAADAWWKALQAVEDEAKEIWQETHGCDSCPENPETGYHMIDPNCPECHGEGQIL